LNRVGSYGRLAYLCKLTSLITQGNALAIGHYPYTSYWLSLYVDEMFASGLSYKDILDEEEKIYVDL
jgi:ascorbate-specific PTS system EIIC-type component UlaA